MCACAYDLYTLGSIVIYEQMHKTRFTLRMGRIEAINIETIKSAMMGVS